MKIIKIVATRCHILKAKMHQIRFQLEGRGEGRGRKGLRKGEGKGKGKGREEGVEIAWPDLQLSLRDATAIKH